MKNIKIKTNIWAFPQQGYDIALLGSGYPFQSFLDKKKSKKGFPLLSLTQNLSFTSTTDNLIINK